MAEAGRQAAPRMGRLIRIKADFSIGRDAQPQPQVSEAQIAAIVQYVRELQRANGIFRQEHQM